MTRRSLILAVFLSLTPSGIFGQWDKYVDEKYVTVDPTADGLVAELRSEIQKVLDAGPLAPHRCVFADTMDDMYFMYWQPGRIITTLVAAYPYLSADQQKAVVKYVRAELGDAERAPWCPKGHLPPDKGARRELHTFNQALGWQRYWGQWGSKKPILGSFYGIWLYADRTGDWDTVQTHYGNIAQFYRNRSSQGELYGTMGAHLAMARLAEKQNDAALAKLSRGNAAAAFQAGLSFAEIEKRTQKYYKERYDKRQFNRTHMGWMFLDVCPEVARYLADNVKDDVLARHREGLKRYPLFWLREAPYGSRWTGDEGLGIPTELMGMIVPLERWVAAADAKTLASYTRSTPICLGDCYWIEMLVHAIEATGRTTWQKA